MPPVIVRLRMCEIPKITLVACLSYEFHTNCCMTMISFGEYGSEIKFKLENLNVSTYSGHLLEIFGKISLFGSGYGRGRQINP